MSSTLKLDLALQAELEAEREYHNRVYLTTTPFDFPTLKIDPAKVWQHLQPMYKPGGHIRGQRNRRFFELMELDSIAGKTVVDFGCGEGSSGVFVAMHGGNVVGMDISEVGVEQANEVAAVNGVADNCRFFVGNASATGLESNSADLIILKAVLHHFVKYPGIEQEIWRILKPGGRVVFADIIRENHTYNFFTKLYHATGVETDHGDTITLQDYRRFSRRYIDVCFERRSILESVKRLIPKKYRTHMAARQLVKTACRIDSYLLRQLPSLESKTLEIMGTMTKPQGKAG